MRLFCVNVWYIYSEHMHSGHVLELISERVCVSFLQETKCVFKYIFFLIGVCFSMSNEKYINDNKDNNVN